jgi:hypothetical protein
MYPFPTSNIEGTNQRHRLLSMEIEHDRVAGEWRDSQNRARQSWGEMKHWFCDTNHDEAQTCLFDLYSTDETEWKKLESFSRLRELAGEDYKTNFSVVQDSESDCLFWIFLGVQRCTEPLDSLDVVSSELDGAINIRTLPLHLSYETSLALKGLLEPNELLEDVLIKLGLTDFFEALKEAFRQTNEVSALIQAARENSDGEIEIELENDAYPLVLFLPPLPDSLTGLRIPDGHLLTKLPDLPESLEHLVVCGSAWLQALPDFPPRLKGLVLADSTTLVALPNLPNTLEDLYLDGCESLETLPPLPETLTALSVEGCLNLSVEYSQLPSGLKSYTDQAGTEHDLSRGAPIAPTPHEVWYSLAGRSESDIDALKESWSAVKNTPFYKSFESLLHRLLEDDFEGLVSADDMVEVINEVIESSVARKLIFQEAQTAGQDCHDRPLVIFNTVQSLARFNRLQRESAPVEEVLALAEGMLKLALLDEATGHVMTRQWREGRRSSNRDNSGPNVSEALEVQLELRRALGDELALPFKANSLYSYLFATLSEHDRQFAKQFVQDRMADMAGRISGLISIPMWGFYVKQQCQTELEAIDEKYGSLLERLEDEKERLNSQEYDDKCRQIQAAREAEIDGVLYEHTKKLVNRHA